MYEIQQLLIQIKSCSELNNQKSFHNISYLSKYGLDLLHYALFAIEYQQASLPFTSISASSALYDVYADLFPLAKSYNVKLKFESSPNLELVYANKTSLQGSIYALVAGLITGINTDGPKNITIAVQQTKPKQQRVGVYSNNMPVGTHLVKKSLSMATSHNRMFSPKITHRSGLGFAVSKELAESLNAKYHSFEHVSNKGIGYYLPESAQLSLL